MSSEDKIWEKPDPRIKWALDILDPKGNEENFINYFWYPGLFASAFGVSYPLSNLMGKRPWFASLHLTAAMTAFGWVAGVYTRNYWMDKNAEEIAVCKHYLMLHPEKFPEPEKKKWGDKEVLLEWPINR